MIRIFDESRPLRVWKGDLTKGQATWNITLWREISARDDEGVMHLEGAVKERQAPAGPTRTVHEVSFEVREQDLVMTRLTEPRHNLDVRFDPPLLVCHAWMRAGEDTDSRAPARVLDLRDPSTLRYTGSARQRSQLRNTPAGLELKSELSIDLGLPTLRVRSRLIIDHTDPAHPFAAQETTDALVKLGIAPIIREKRQLTWEGETLDPDPR